MSAMFQVWRPDMDEDREYRKPVQAFDHQSAAEAACDRNFSNWDYPSFIEVSVAEVGSDDVREFEVEVRSVPEFIARPRAPRSNTP